MNNSREKAALAAAFGVLAMLAKHSLSPTQTAMATRAAGNCLWALGIDEYEGFRAEEPEGPVVEHAVLLPHHLEIEL